MSRFQRTQIAVLLWWCLCEGFDPQDKQDQDVSHEDCELFQMHLPDVAQHKTAPGVSKVVTAVTEVNKSTAVPSNKTSQDKNSQIASKATQATGVPILYAKTFSQYEPKTEALTRTSEKGGPKYTPFTPVYSDKLSNRTEVLQKVDAKKALEQGVSKTEVKNKGQLPSAGVMMYIIIGSLVLCFGLAITCMFLDAVPQETVPEEKSFDEKLSENFGDWEVVISEEHDYACAWGHRHTGDLATASVHGQFYKKLDRKLVRGKSIHSDVRRTASSLAANIVMRAKDISEAVSQEPDMLHSQWDGVDNEDPLDYLFDVRKTGDNDVVLNGLLRMCDQIQQHYQKKPALNRAPLPAKVFGDIHGQFRDLLLFLHHYGFPSQLDDPVYVFNGDWVDRGKHQLETVALLFALKLAYPEHIFLNRGNHEDALVNSMYGDSGFHCKCIRRFGQDKGQQLFDSFGRTWDLLPLGTLLGGRILIVHGGIGDGQWDLKKLQDAPRPCSSEDLDRDPVLYNILWSDPIDEDQRTTFGVHSSPRDQHAYRVLQFTQSVTEDFCQRNDLALIIRSHQALVSGTGYEVMHGGRLIRVFSARDYEKHGNDGAIVSIDKHVKEKRILVRPQLLQSLTKLNQAGVDSERGFPTRQSTELCNHAHQHLSASRELGASGRTF